MNITKDTLYTILLYLPKEYIFNVYLINKKFAYLTFKCHQILIKNKVYTYYFAQICNAPSEIFKIFNKITNITFDYYKFYNKIKSVENKDIFFNKYKEYN